ncbi:hypothetical protein [Enhygromyxa salina]|uniref:HEAT repeat protein n=1 Tax=Enhygromyxa salina TaxID=215803 RepID=A0A2S9YMM7_9BACT|nr:hypothetical protein [Enhygromyxa salina]PRQ06326.1 hypothetical protein ENSA7_40030 [Enhygromyxa salina]
MPAARSLSRSPLWPVVERHLDELEATLEAWHDGLDAPDFNLGGLAELLESRVELHLDGLRVAGPAALEPVIWPMFFSMFETADESRAAAASLAVLTLAPTSAWGPLLDALGGNDDALTSGVTRALCLAQPAGLDGWLQTQIAAPESEAQPHRLAGLVRALADRGGSPRELTTLLTRPEPELLGAAAYAARHARDPASAHALAALLDHQDPRVRAEAIESGLIRQQRSAWAAAQAMAFEQHDPSTRRRALTWVAAIGDIELHERLLARLGACGDALELADLLWAASVCGRPAAVDLALAHLGDAKLGPLAGEVICAITGLTGEEEQLWQDRPLAEDGLPPLALDDLDADLTLSSDDLLPMPEPVALAQWWTQRRADLLSAPRLLAGQPWSSSNLLEQLRHGPLRRNHALGLELAVRSAGLAQVNTRTWVAQQVRALGATSSDTITLVRGLGVQDG